MIEENKTNHLQEKQTKYLLEKAHQILIVVVVLCRSVYAGPILSFTDSSLTFTVRGLVKKLKAKFPDVVLWTGKPIFIKNALRQYNK